ncbi:hypothetical protein [Reichenbachiella versicolor]|uniref:hypothetical protein n=1 Tax=Reichenbachiella versicolor TaxID=1821036 RepID=UPI000D6E072F|nr:hypothetical protein [Reichenbachiella versicolor]
MHLVHNTNNAKIWQSDIENCFYFDFKGQQYKLNVCGFIALKTKLINIDIEEMIISDELGADIAIVPLCNDERLLVLTIDEILELRELFPGAMVMLELNSILHSRVYSSTL